MNLLHNKNALIIPFFKTDISWLEIIIGAAAIIGCVLSLINFFSARYEKRRKNRWLEIRHASFEEKRERFVDGYMLSCQLDIHNFSAPAVLTEIIVEFAEDENVCQGKRQTLTLSHGNGESVGFPLHIAKNESVQLVVNAEFPYQFILNPKQKKFRMNIKAKLRDDKKSNRPADISQAFFAQLAEIV